MKISTHFVNYGRLSPPNFEVGAAASIHPNSILVAPPGAPRNAGRFAALANQADFSARAFSAIVALEVTGFAIEVLNETVTVTATIRATIRATIMIMVTATIMVTVTVAIMLMVTAIIAVAIIRAGHEFGAAASIHPDAASVITPGPPRNTGRVTVLTRQADAAARVSGAIIAPHIVRLAT